MRDVQDYDKAQAGKSLDFPLEYWSKFKEIVVPACLENGGMLRKSDTELTCRLFVGCWVTCLLQIC